MKFQTSLILFLLTLLSYTDMLYIDRAFASDEVAVQRVIIEAKDKNLASSRYWEILLHYKEGWVSGYRGLIDDSAFYLSPSGNVDMDAELNATIRGITSTEPFPIDKHPQCRFPARTAWLLDELPSIKELLPQVDCPQLDNITAKIDPYKATIIFPYYNMSGPGSMFGHTLIRLDSKDATPLSGYAVTYAADAQKASAIMYIIKGVGGGFDGVYSVIPYYQKLNEYAAIEMRDVWEYELNLTPDEVQRMYLHIWEVSRVKSDYYFFDENCAYNLLFLLEAARPTANLTEDVITVIPLDTIRRVTDNNMVKEVHFKPSYRKRMEAMAGKLSNKAIGVAYEIADGGYNVADLADSDISERQQVGVLDLASELIRYNHQNATPEEIVTYREKSVYVLTARSKYKLKNEYVVERPLNSPEQGHKSARFLVGGGYSNYKDGDYYINLGTRASYHSLEDIAVGYLEGSEISLLDVNMRYYTKSKKFNINDIKLFDIKSLTPQGRLFSSPSWAVSVGMADRSIRPDRTDIVSHMNVGVGVAFELMDSYLVWGMGVAEVQLADKYSSNLSVGYGGEGGVIIPTGSYGKLVSQGSYLWYTDNGKHIEGSVGAKYAIYLNVENAITASGKWSKKDSDYVAEYGLSYTHFF